ncbi:FAD:protein FMN transferase [Cellulophaga baltica]|uniref:FAD:protein FMN transferase n=1 Tax=Cellulophaga TaxID=104264 RepID=UPI001C067E5D|nr:MULTISPECIES: FAD:protein FMN transferase [Cellulophaga]MBU2996909.1 FAD:protein FMN transferase [Cellulophaga baltica]MDO6768307.1 FAD:protein FMN transferase [Cellulophaga sp. 1_MG-2023]
MKSMKLMGSRFDITIVDTSEEKANKHILEAVAEINRIEKIISSWDSDSETSKINKNAGIKPVKVSAELISLIERAIKISEISDGAFDITYASMDKIWKFDGTMKNIPTALEMEQSVKKVGYKNIVLDKEASTVFLKNKGVKIGFGAIGKGYAADKAKALMKSKNIFAGIINASGDLSAWGKQASGEKWIVGISNPLDKEKVFSWLPIMDSSVATSGNYEKFILCKGEKYSHIIDPRTGYPSKGINSVTIFSKSAELCDALATAVFIMGKDTGLSFINQLKGVDVIIVDSNNEIHKSEGIEFTKNQ